MSTSTPWWVGAAVYHIYVRSFFDADGDGFGDLRGIISRLDYLEDLGVDAIWLSPTMPSPNADWGYDVADYEDVDPELGTLETMDELVRRARDRGMRVMLDLVPNHSSSEHPWFLDAASRRDSPYRDYYIWRDPRPDGSLPNNWLDDTGAPAWTWHPVAGQYYLHNFTVGQPELNWREPAVHAEFDRIMDFWFDRGIAGFRIDVANGLYKDERLRDNPRNDEVLPGITPVPGTHGLQNIHNFNQPEVHDVFKHWRARAELRQDVPVLLGETWVTEVEDLARYYGDGTDELHLAFNFPLIFTDWATEAIADVVERSIAALPPGAVPIWAGSNHDLERAGTRWAAGDVRRMRLIHTMLATLPGVWNIYYGDELGMPDSDIPGPLHRDPLTAQGLNGQWPRDNARSPMRWDASPSGGFSQGRPWLPLHPDVALNVATQLADPTSTLRLVQRLVRLRREHFGSTSPDHAVIELAADRWIYRTGDLRVHLNTSDEPIPVEIVGTPVLSSHSIEPTTRELSALLPWEAVVTRV